MSNQTEDPHQYIELEGVQTNNLKNFDCRIPKEAFTVVSGVSGSGKSSLAFDTLYAEGQRRYTESLSTYARQFLRRMKKPPIEAIRRIQPALALKQKNDISNARSTVGTVTEIDDFLQLLFAHLGTTICPDCEQPVTKDTVENAVDSAAESFDGQRIVLTAELDTPDPDYRDAFLKHLVQEGYRRLFLDGETRDITSLDFDRLMDLDQLLVIVDRLKVGNDEMRLSEAIEEGFRLGNGVIRLYDYDSPDNEPTIFDTAFRCNTCRKSFPEPKPALFSFNGSLGACPTCSGFGKVTGVSRTKVIPNTDKSLEAGAISCFESKKFSKYKRYLLRGCADQSIPVDIPYKKLTDRQKKFIWEGGDDWIGVQGFFDRLKGKRYKKHVRIFMARYRGYSTCPDCDGTRLTPEARQVKLQEASVSDIWQMRLSEAKSFFDGLDLTEAEYDKVERLLAEIQNRLDYLTTIGVGYLTLDRQSRTLSGGELQRIHLTTSLGRALTETLYVLDEPTAGMHAEDTEQLVEVIEQLRDLGNTVVVVEHDPDVIEASDYVVELGPEGGEKGGDIIFAGWQDEFQDGDTLTARTLEHRQNLEPADYDDPGEYLSIVGAREHNLRDIDVDFPVGRLSAVSGPSGSGKSTLCEDILFEGWKQRTGKGGVEAGAFNALEGLDRFAEVILMDQSALSRSSRSNPLSYTNALGPIRRMFSKTKQAKMAGLTKGDFSYNTKGGRCEECEGRGFKTVEMHFMADIEIECDVCNGKHFNDRVLSAKYRGKNINDVFEMTVDEGIAFFDHRDSIVNRLQPLRDVGLGYIRLGQTTDKLSGGEAQRLKLASYIAEGEKKGGSDPVLFIFDEPTVGLHLLDVDTLVIALRKLVKLGHTVIAIEHNLDFIAQCDYVVDLGPGAGPDGGDIVGTGGPAEIAKASNSKTGEHLKELLG